MRHLTDGQMLVKTLLSRIWSNVQEMSVTLFCSRLPFGPDADGGKLSLNFGPLNKDGGWKHGMWPYPLTDLVEMVLVMTADIDRSEENESKGLRL